LISFNICIILKSLNNFLATSKIKGRGKRGMYKSYVVDMKIKERGSKLKITIPEEMDRAIGDNARHLVNECERVMRTKAPLNVKVGKKHLRQLETVC
jgi:hypothetical protein